MIAPVVLRYIRALAKIQTRTITPIIIPDLSTVTGRKVRAVVRAASLIEGDTVVGTWTDLTFEKDPEIAVDPNASYEIASIEPLVVTIGVEEITLGAVKNTLLSAKLVEADNGMIEALPHSNNTLHQIFAPDEPVPNGLRKLVHGRQV